MCKLQIVKKNVIHVFLLLIKIMQKIYFICCVSQFIKHEVGLHSIWNLALSMKYRTEYENPNNDMVKLLDRYFIVRTMKYLRGFCTLKCPIFNFF